MKANRPIRFKVYARAVIAILLIVSWVVLSFTGLLLWLAPSGRRAGQVPLLLNLTKNELGDVHFWIAVATVVVTVVHMIVDWKALRGVIRYLTSVHRSPEIISK